MQWHDTTYGRSCSENNGYRCCFSWFMRITSLSSFSTSTVSDRNCSQAALLPSSGGHTPACSASPKASRRIDSKSCRPPLGRLHCRNWQGYFDAQACLCRERIWGHVAESQAYFRRSFFFPITQGCEMLRECDAASHSRTHAGSCRTCAAQPVAGQLRTVRVLQTRIPSRARNLLITHGEFDMRGRCHVSKCLTAA